MLSIYFICMGYTDWDLSCLNSAIALDAKILKCYIP